MDENEYTEEEGGEAEASSPVDANSIMAELRRRRENIGSDTETYLDIPGLEGASGVQLVGKYRRLSYGEIEKIAQKVEKSKHPRKTLMAQVDTIAMALVEMCIRLPDGTLKPLAEIVPGRDPDNPVLYDNALGEFLGFDPEGSARKAVLATFNNDLAIPKHHNDLAVWFQDSAEAEDEDFTVSS